MIKTEVLENVIHTWSDLGMKIHGGYPEGDYDEAYDPIDSGRTYVETNIPVDEDATAQEIVDILTGEIE